MTNTQVVTTERMASACEPTTRLSASPSRFGSALLVGFAFVGCIFLLVCATLFAYRSSLDGVFLLDDDINIVSNPAIRQISPISKHLIGGGMRGFTNLTFAISYAQNGPDARIFHWGNLFIHCLAATGFLLLVFLSLETCPGLAGTSAMRLTVAFVTALIWAVHPLNTQGVTYIVQRAESLAGAMLFWSLAFYALGCKCHTRLRHTYFALAFVSCWLGMLSKETMLMALPIVVLFDRAVCSVSWRESVRRRGALWLLVLVPALLATPKVLKILFSEQSAAGFRMSEVTWFEYVGTQPTVLLHYLSLCVIPYRQCFDYGWPPEQRSAVIALSGGLLLAATIGLVVMFRAKPWWAFWPLAALFVLVPTTVVPLQDLAAEHRMYTSLALLLVPCVTGIWLLVRAMVRKCVHRDRYVIVMKLGVAVGCVALIGCLAGLTASRNRVYASSVLMWQDVIDYVEQNDRGSMWLSRAYANLGEALGNQGDFEASLDALQRAEREPKFPAKIYANRARALIALNRLDEAEEAISHAMQAEAPTARLRQQAGIVAVRRGNLELAVEHFAAARKLDPSDLVVGANYARALAQSGKRGEAIAIYDELIMQDPRFAEAHRRMVELHLDAREYDLAKEKAFTYVTLLPKDAQARLLLGLTELASGKPEEALKAWEPCSGRAPPRLWQYRGTARLQMNEIAQAVVAFQNELNLYPTNVDAIHSLARIHAQNSPSLAEPYFERLVEIMPQSAEMRYQYSLLLVNLGKKAKAKAELEIILLRSPTFAPATRLLSQLSDAPDSVETP
jgi:tetratricopeptide (TPR) repeat protein